MIRDTSKLAYDELKFSGDLQEQERNIMRALHTQSEDRDWSLQEISRLTGMPINAVSGRVNGLKKKCYLEECERRRCRVTGNTIRPVRIA